MYASASGAVTQTLKVPRPSASPPSRAALKRMDAHGTCRVDYDSIASIVKERHPNLPTGAGVSNSGLRGLRLAHRPVQRHLVPQHDQVSVRALQLGALPRTGRTLVPVAPCAASIISADRDNYFCRLVTRVNGLVCPPSSCSDFGLRPFIFPAASGGARWGL